MSNSPGIVRQTLWLTDFEVRKLFRQKQAYIGAAVVLLLSVLCAIGIHLHRVHAEARGRQFAGRLVAELINGITFAETVLLPGVYMLLPMVVAIYAAGCLAGEWQLGLVRTVCVRPISRWQLLVAKLAALSLYAYFLLLTQLAVSLGLGWALFGLAGDVITADPRLWGSPRALFIMPEAVAWQRMLLSYFFAGYSLISICALTLMFAAFLRRSTVAAAVPLGVYYTSLVLGWLPFLENLQRFLPTRYLMAWKYFLAPEIPWADILHDGSFLALYTFAYLLVAGFAFARADL